jgi:[ribosomal protein S5]-alanine N-acetyltransferase
MFEQVGETPRLIMELLSLGHVVPLTPALTDARVNAHFLEGSPKTKAELETQFAQMLAGPGKDFPDETWLNFAVRFSTSPLYLGRLEATVQKNYAEIAYLFDANFWGNGYATEAVNWLLHFIKSHHRINSFWATVSPDNDRSALLLTRVGFKRAEKATWPLLRTYDEGDDVFYISLKSELFL